MSPPTHSPPQVTRTSRGRPAFANTSSAGKAVFGYDRTRVYGEAHGAGVTAGDLDHGALAGLTEPGEDRRLGLGVDVAHDHRGAGLTGGGPPPVPAGRPDRVALGSRDAAIVGREYLDHLGPHAQRRYRDEGRQDRSSACQAAYEIAQTRQTGELTEAEAGAEGGEENDHHDERKLRSGTLCAIDHDASSAALGHRARTPDRQRRHRGGGRDRGAADGQPATARAASGPRRLGRDPGAATPPPRRGRPAPRGYR